MIRKFLWFLLGLVILVFGVIVVGSHFFTEWMWFENLGFLDVFVFRLSWEWGFRLVSWLGLALFLFLNIITTKPVINQVFFRYPNLSQYIKAKYLTWIALGGSLFLGFVYSSGYSGYYWQIAQFFNSGEFGIADPIFNRDLGFFFFDLPMYHLITSALLSGLVLSLVVCTGIYFLTGSFRFENQKFILASRAKKHLSVLAGLAVLVKGISYYFDGFELLYGSSGAAFGAGFTDVNIRLTVLKISLIVAIFVGILLISQLYRFRKLFYGSLILWLGVSFIGGVILPGAIQQWIVEPNEFTRELPYLNHHIEMTRLAYGVDQFSEKEFPLKEELTWEDIDGNRAMIDNIRLWDPRLVLNSYSQLQEMRPYYSFIDADVGRYLIDGQLRQVLLSARELDVRLTQNRNWINDHLQYTHGYGVVVSPVNEISSQQLPQFWVGDIPPRGHQDLQVAQPRIYFGERTNQYVITNAEIEEFDYPASEGNAYYTYTGDAGVRLASSLHRLMFSIRFGTTRIMLSSDLNTDSRILFDRNIRTRVQKIAPFLKYDNDPYIVISDEGNLYWIMDAYTVSNRFPYAQPTYGWGNYIRNSVKVVVNAYDGTVGFYQIEEDPLLDVYNSIFPGWLQSLEDVPEGLDKHFRYPEDLLAIQAQIYGTYHMTDTRVFYNREDVWVFAQEVYADNQQDVTPYYVVMNLPDESQSEMVLMMPFTPVRRNNMIAWLAARNDGDNYGEVIVYRFPKDSLTLGPAQIDATIDQDSDISQLLSLWGQRGSNVIRGNLLVLPIGNGLLYVEPLFLQSEQSSMPQLQRVILAHQDRLVMESTLERALEVIFGNRTPTMPELSLDSELESDLEQDFMPTFIGELPERALELFQQAQTALQEADFARFGDAWKELELILNDLVYE